MKNRFRVNFMKLRSLFRGKRDLVVAALVSKADGHRDSGDWIMAQASYKEALAINPGLPHIWIQYGHSLKETGHLKEALSAYLRASEQDPKSADAAAQIGSAYRMLGLVEEAAIWHGRAVKLDPSWTDIWVQYGHALKDTNRATKALEAYFMALSQKPGVADTALQIGHAYKLSGQLATAIVWYARSLGFDPDFAPARRELRAVGWNSRQIDDVISIAEVEQPGVSLSGRRLLVDVTQWWLSLSNMTDVDLACRIDTLAALQLANELNASLAVLKDGQVLELISDAGEIIKRALQEQGNLPKPDEIISSIAGHSIFIAESKLWSSFRTEASLRQARLDQDVVAISYVIALSDNPPLSEEKVDGIHADSNCIVSIGRSAVAVACPTSAMSALVRSLLLVTRNPAPTVHNSACAFKRYRATVVPGRAGIVIIADNIPPGFLTQIKVISDKAVTIITNGDPTEIAKQLEADAAGQDWKFSQSSRILAVNSTDAANAARDATILLLPDPKTDIHNFTVEAARNSRPIAASIHHPCFHIWGGMLHGYFETSRPESLNDIIGSLAYSASQSDTLLLGDFSDPAMRLISNAITGIIADQTLHSPPGLLNMRPGSLHGLWDQKGVYSKSCVKSGFGACVGDGWINRSPNGVVAKGRSIKISGTTQYGANTKISAIILVANESHAVVETNFKSRIEKKKDNNLILHPGQWDWIDLHTQLQSDSSFEVSLDVSTDGPGLTILAVVLFSSMKDERWFDLLSEISAGGCDYLLRRLKSIETLKSV
jgi:tetratricopeptide (TPR) repeat protein